MSSLATARERIIAAAKKYGWSRDPKPTDANANVEWFCRGDHYVRVRFSIRGVVMTATGNDWILGPNQRGKESYVLDKIEAHGITTTDRSMANYTAPDDGYPRTWAEAASIAQNGTRGRRRNRPDTYGPGSDYDDNGNWRASPVDVDFLETAPITSAEPTTVNSAAATANTRILEAATAHGWARDPKSAYHEHTEWFSCGNQYVCVQYSVLGEVLSAFGRNWKLNPDHHDKESYVTDVLKEHGTMERSPC